MEIEWKVGRVGKSKPAASPSWAVDDLSDSLHQASLRTVFPWFQSGPVEMHGTHVCLLPSLHRSVLQSTPKFLPRCDGSPQLLTFLPSSAACPSLLFFILLAVSITHQVLFVSGPLPLLFCMPGMLSSPRQPHRTGFSISFGLCENVT